MKANVLVISYVFPPQGGIAGRRWAKFAKWLERQGIGVTVLAAAPQKGGTSLWQHDIESLNVHYYPSKYPKQFLSVPKTFATKVHYHILKNLFALRFKGAFYDRTIADSNRITGAARSILQQGDYTALVVSAPPYRYLFDLLKLKPEFPEVRFIADFRDPWTRNKTSFGFDRLPEKRFRYEQQLEEAVLQSYDTVFCVHGNLFSEEQQKPISRKLVEVPNGFDPDDLGGLNVRENRESDTGKLDLVFAGTYYDKADHLLEKLDQVLAQLQLNNKRHYGQLQLTFYGKHSGGLVKLNRHHPEIVNLKAPIPVKDMLERINRADAAMLFLTNDLDYSFSTKFCEYVGLEKPILVFSEERGQTAAFVEENGIGWGLHRQNMKTQLIRLIEVFREHKTLSFNTSFQKDRFNIQHIAARMLPYFGPKV